MGVPSHLVARQSLRVRRCGRGLFACLFGLRVGLRRMCRICGGRRGFFAGWSRMVGRRWRAAELWQQCDGKNTWGGQENRTHCSGCSPRNLGRTEKSFYRKHRQASRAAGPPTNTSYRSAGANPLPLVAKHHEKLPDPSGLVQESRSNPPFGFSPKKRLNYPQNMRGRHDADFFRECLTLCQSEHCNPHRNRSSRKRRRRPPAQEPDARVISRNRSK